MSRSSLLALLVSLSGCGGAAEHGPHPAEGHLRGDIGALEGLDHSADVWAMTGFGSIALELQVDDSRGVAMHLIELDGISWDDPRLASGLSVSLHEGVGLTDRGERVVALACAGAAVEEIAEVAVERLEILRQDDEARSTLRWTLHAPTQVSSGSLVLGR